MQAESLEVLERADFSPAQARAIVRAIEIEIGGAQHTLAIKHDVVELRAEMKTLATKAELHAAMSGLARQMYLAVLSQTAVMLGFTYFLVPQLR